MNRYIKLIIFLLILIFSVNLCANPRSDITEGNKSSKTVYIKNNLKIGVVYKQFNNPEKFKKILIGNWSSPPYSKYSFNRNGKFQKTFIDSMNNRKKKIGHWKAQKNKLYLKYNLRNKWKIYDIFGYKLEKIPFKHYYKYSLEVAIKKRNEFAFVLYLELK